MPGGKADGGRRGDDSSRRSFGCPKRNSQDEGRTTPYCNRPLALVLPLLARKTTGASAHGSPILPSDGRVAPWWSARAALGARPASGLPRRQKPRPGPRHTARARLRREPHLKFDRAAERHALPLGVLPSRRLGERGPLASAVGLGQCADRCHAGRGGRRKSRPYRGPPGRLGPRPPIQGRLPAAGNLSDHQDPGLPRARRRLPGRRPRSPDAPRLGRTARQPHVLHDRPLRVPPLRHRRTRQQGQLLRAPVSLRSQPPSRFRRRQRTWQLDPPLHLGRLPAVRRGDGNDRSADDARRPHRRLDRSGGRGPPQRQPGAFVRLLVRQAALGHAVPPDPRPAKTR